MAGWDDVYRTTRAPVGTTIACSAYSSLQGAFVSELTLATSSTSTAVCPSEPPSDWLASPPGAGVGGAGSSFRMQKLSKAHPGRLQCQGTSGAKHSEANASSRRPHTAGSSTSAYRAAR